MDWFLYDRDLRHERVNLILRLKKTAMISPLSVLPSYRNKSIDLLCKSIDWFLCEGNTGN